MELDLMPDCVSLMQYAFYACGGSTAQYSVKALLSVAKRSGLDRNI